jgi:hypothetical protein
VGVGDPQAVALAAAHVKRAVYQNLAWDEISHIDLRPNFCLGLDFYGKLLNAPSGLRDMDYYL